MCRAGRLAGRGSRRPRIVHAGRIAVVLVPGILAPVDGIRQDGLRILRERAILLADLLAELHGSCRAGLDTEAAGNAVLRRDLCRIGRAGQVRRIEEHARAQGIADLHIAVADVEDLRLAVDVRDLVDEAVVLCLLDDLERLIGRDVVGTVRLDRVVSHIADLDAPVFGVVSAALAELRARVAA